MKCYSVIERNDLSSHENIWMNFTCILLRERKQSIETTYSMRFQLYTVWKRKNYRDNKKISKCQWIEKKDK